MEDVQRGKGLASINSSAEGASATAVVMATVKESASLWGSDGARADSYDSTCALFLSAGESQLSLLSLQLHLKSCKVCRILQVQYIHHFAI